MLKYVTLKDILLSFATVILGYFMLIGIIVVLG